ncbi:MAG: MMPL family transporter, partial [Bdellovibrionota bacterium]
MIAPRVYWFPRLLLRWATPIALVGLLLGGGSAYFTAKLFLNLRTDIEELLPSTARSVLDLNEVGSRLKSIDSLAILALDDQDVMASRRFVDDLAAALSQRRDDGIAGVEYRIQNEIQFFRERGALFFQNSDLVKIREYLQTRIQYERDVRNPLNIFSQVSLDEPKFDFGGLRLKYGAKTSAYSRFPDGYYATPDQKKRVILVHLAGKASAVGQALKLKQAVDEEIARLDPSQYSPTLQIKFTGGIQQVLEEHEALIEDLGLSTLIVTVLVVLSMWIFFRSALATASLILSLFIGTFVTFTFAFFTVGYLNANSAFLGSIVIGNGINFGIILLARYVEERRKGLGHPRAVYISVTRTASATFIAALAAGISYGSLMLTGFRGFSQFGAIGLAGMIFCWLAAYL